MKTGLLTLLILGSLAAFATPSGGDVVNLTCVDTREPGLKEVVLVTQPNGKMRARVTVANDNSPTETYSYMIRRLPPTPRRIAGPVIYRAALGRFELSICRTCAPIGGNAFHSNLTFTVSKKAKVNEPYTQMAFKDVACRLNE